MSRIISRPGPRFIYPELVSSPSLSRCGLVANALWPRLICQADDQGRLQGDAGAVLVACFPKLLATVSHGDVEQALAELKAARMILIYRALGEQFVQIAGWWRWQQGMRRAYASRFPAPRGWIDITYGYEQQPTSFGNALESGGFVLESDGRVRAVRPQSAGKVRAVRGQPARSNARAQGHDPTRIDPTHRDPSSTDPTRERARDVPPRSAPATNGRTKEPDQRAIDGAASILADEGKPEAVRRAARDTLRRYAPERLAELEAAAG